MNRFIAIVSLAFGLIGAPLAMHGIIGQLAYAATGDGSGGSGATAGSGGTGASAGGGAASSSGGASGATSPGPSSGSVGGHGSKTGTLKVPYRLPENPSSTGTR